MEIYNKKGELLFTGEKKDLKCAILENADLRYVNLENANLENTNLRYANLFNANLENTNLRYANLFNANLFNANLKNADLRYANLENADLRYANLENADLRYANLENADLRYANLESADLKYASLENTSLENANLENTSLENANLFKAKYSYISILKIFINTKNPDLILELMLWDAESCGLEKMNSWVETNICPFSDSQRDFYFPESKEIWKNRNKNTKKYKTLKKLFIAVAEDLKIRI
jgi:hypothetical protein